jgi:hypothetical protein
MSHRTRYASNPSTPIHIPSARQVDDTCEASHNIVAEIAHNNDRPTLRLDTVP